MWSGQGLHYFGKQKLDRTYFGKQKLDRTFNFNEQDVIILVYKNFKSDHMQGLRSLKN